MNDELETEAEAEAEPAPQPAAKGTTVTSTVTIDFPSLDWGINAGETRELPHDEAAQAVILATRGITISK